MKKGSASISAKSKSKASKTEKKVTPLYPVSSLTKNSKSNLWVAFEANNSDKGLVYSSTLTRDAVRNATAKAFGMHMNDIRSRRVANYRKIA